MNSKYLTILLIAAAASSSATERICPDTEFTRSSTAARILQPGLTETLRPHSYSLTGLKCNDGQPENVERRLQNENRLTKIAAKTAEPIFQMHPTEEEFAGCTVIDGNNDGFKIEYYVRNGLDGTLYDWPIYYNNRSAIPVAVSDADEWIVTPEVYLDDTENLYEISIEALTTSSSMKESFQIVLAESDDIESLRKGTVVMDEPAIYNASYESFTSTFGIKSPGSYRFAIHINSSVDRGWRIGLRDFKVTATTISSSVPASCSDLEIIPDENGELSATAVFTMPSIYINNSPIPSDELITAKITTRAETIEVTGKPGEKISKKVATADGANVITVSFSNSNGTGDSAKGTVYCGIDIPTNPVATSVISDDNMELILRWQPVTDGANGGIVPQSGLTYNIYRYFATSEYGQWVLFEEGLTECEYHLKADSATQDLYQIMVSAKNKKGESMGNIRSYASAMLGTPHKLPMNETFPDKTQKYAGLFIDYPDETYTAQWALDSPSALGITSGPPYALMCLVMEVGNEGKGYAELPKFSTEGCKNARLRLNAYICNATPVTTIRIHSTEGRGNGEVLGVIDNTSGSGWCDLTFELPEKYLDKSWNVISIDADCQIAGQIIAIGEYSIYENLANDLAISSALLPSYICLGDETEISVNVENRGSEPMKTPALKGELRDGSQLLQKIDFRNESAILAENESACYTASLLFEKADLAGKNLTLAVSITDSDDDDSNNSLSRNFRIGVGPLPVVSDLKAVGTADSEDVTISWSHPFEKGYLDNIEGYTHGCHDYNLGVWKNIDFDGANTYYSEGFDLPDSGRPKAFQAINTQMCNMEGMYQPSGDSFLMAFCPEGKTADDWLISPEINGGSPLCFYVTSLSSYYPETIEIMVSATDDDLDSFMAIDSFTLQTAGWGYYTATLPENAKYFAIHYISNDQFGICIDDIVYNPVVAPVEISGWNIYKNGLLVGENLIETTLKDSAPDANAVYRYNVSAIGTRNGVEFEFPQSQTVEYTRNPASADFTVNDDIRILVEGNTLTVEGCLDKLVEITDLGGIRLQSAYCTQDRFSTELPRGIYIVTVNGRSHKIIIW
ncbi:MAG: choice-of-anchor J domain-containing protein [Paramuribaculum sp.]|nr:choice-of-anchor J domain-containing protein [Paramuribaculum sp.]